MCTQSQLNNIVHMVADGAKQLLGDRLNAVLLYGSYARGDYDEESDIDMMILIDCPAEEMKQYRNPFIKLASRLSLDFSVEVSVTLTDTETFTKYKNYLPFYRNVEREGVRIA